MKIDLKKLSGNDNSSLKLHRNIVTSESSDIFMDSKSGAEKLMKGFQTTSMKLDNKNISSNLKISRNEPEKLTAKKSFSRDKNRNSRYITKK